MTLWHDQRVVVRDLPFAVFVHVDKAVTPLHLGAIETHFEFVDSYLDKMLAPMSRLSPDPEAEGKRKIHPAPRYPDKRSAGWGDDYASQGNRKSYPYKRSDWGDDYASQGNRKSDPYKRSDWGDDYTSQGNRKSHAARSYPENALTGATTISTRRKRL
jgi:hypothetical protein